MKLTILRGLPGSGKSTLATKLGGLVLSSDDFFVVDDKYIWDSQMLGAAHRWNIWRCRIAMERQTPHIIIDNTFVKAYEAKPYVLLADEFRYEVGVVETTTPWARDAKELAKRGLHNVPREKIEEQIANWDEDYSLPTILRSKAPWEKDPKKQPMWKCTLGFHNWSKWGYPRPVQTPAGEVYAQHRRCFRCSKTQRLAL